ncbi:hypothetical protein Cni_G26126 [Canna indica]|uniref:Transposase MuDR plant domain-containing protein n=1 Tax=Canna indica TaxID=4628 RepID=A0AAQ3KZ91_9LILI|nr:hypothetical protein Cni_G26126 [Canna indica]
MFSFGCLAYHLIAQKPLLFTGRFSQAEISMKKLYGKEKVVEVMHGLGAGWSSERDDKSNTNTVPARDNVAGEEEGIHSEGDVVVSELDDEWYQNVEDDENEGDSESNLDYVDEEERNDGSESDQLDESYDQIVNVNSNDEIYIDRVMRGKTFERAARLPVLDVNGRVQLEKGLPFLDVNEFREALQDYTIQEGFEIQRIKNEKARVTARCAINGCTWRIHASPTSDGVTYKIKTYNPDHNCIRTTRNYNANSTWIAKRLQSKLVADPEMSYCIMKAELQEKYSLEPANNMQLYRTRRRVKEENQGNHAKSYDKLPAWAKLARVRNPGSVVKMEVDARMSANPLFKMFFVCFDAMKKGFVRGCRPWFGIDGCHLKGTYGGVLLSTVAIDGNKGMFPIAFAVVEGLGSAVSEFFPYAKHRYNVERFCDYYYSNEMYCKTYQEMIHPMPELDERDRDGYPTVDPPELKRLPGRPRTARRRAANEGRAGQQDARRSCTVRCGICKEFGHNRKGCQRGKIANEKEKEALAFAVAKEKKKEALAFGADQAQSGANTEGITQASIGTSTQILL